MPLGKLAKIVAGTLGLLATVFAIIQGVRDYRAPVPKLQAAVVNVEHVSSRTEIPDVKVSLAFKDQSVSDLWLCRVRFQNIGGVTLYSTGARPNTQSPIIISVPERYEILKIEEKGIDPKDSGFEAHITQKKDDKGVFNKHQFEVMFEQWRKGEAIEAVLYLAGSGNHLDRPKLIPKGRPILDGDVVSMDLSTGSPVDAKLRSTPSLERLIGPRGSAALRLLGILSISIIAPAVLIRKDIVVLPWQEEHPVAGFISRIILAIGLYGAMFLTVW